MGFIEEERRKRAAAELKEQQRIRPIMDQQERERKQREVSEDAARIDQAKSTQQFEQSGLGEMIHETSRLGMIHDSRFTGGGSAEVVVRPSLNGNGINKVVSIETTPDGTITIQGGLLGSTTLSKSQWSGSNGREVLEKALEKAYNHPRSVKEKKHDYSDPNPLPPYTGDGGPCLPGDSLISAPKGFVPVKNLKSGDLVWTVDRFGRRIQAPIIQKTKRLVSKDHKMAHIVLKDGRELIVSPGHPTIDNKELGNLVKGQVLDKSQIVSIQIMPYKEQYTYDILPSGDTGGYWANIMLIGSTLSNQFKQTLNFA